MDLGGVESLRSKMVYLSEDLNRQVWKCMNTVCRDTVARAKELCPVRTGRLRSSIYGHVSRNLVMKVGATAPYAKFVEFGTRYMAPRAFLTQALLENTPRFAVLIREAIRLALRERRRIYGR